MNHIRYTDDLPRLSLVLGTILSRPEIFAEQDVPFPHPQPAGLAWICECARVSQSGDLFCTWGFLSRTKLEENSRTSFARLLPLPIQPERLKSPTFPGGPRTAGLAPLE